MYYLLIAILLPAFLIGAEKPSIHEAYKRPEAISQDTWNALSPNFLPKKHPIKPTLDRLFKSSRIILDSYTLRDAGFYNPEPHRYSHTIVSGHPNLKGYLLKMYTDEQPGIVDWLEFNKRIEGAMCIRESIERLGYSKLFKVPKKWLYPIPETPEHPPGLYPKHFVLVVEDMNINSKEINERQWRGATLTPKLLDAVYVVLQDVGLNDSVYPFNLPFTDELKLAFIDTARFHLWPVQFEKLTKYLSPEMQKYWQKIILNGGPKKKKCPQ